MRKILPFLVFFASLPAHADVQTLNDALRSTYTACVGIDEDLSDLKKMAGINTAVTAVGAATGIGATAVGIAKTSADQKAEELEKILAEIAELSKNQPPMTEPEVKVFMSEFNNAYSVVLTSTEDIESELEKTTQKSKNLGNWRTGLMAGSTATNVAGAIIASTNKVDKDLEAQIKTCLNQNHRLYSTAKSCYLH